MESTALPPPPPPYPQPLPPPPPYPQPLPPPVPSLRPPELEINDRQLAIAAEIFASHFKGALELDTDGFLSTISSLARFIDFALSNDDIPTTAQCLPSILKQVYVHKNDTALLSAITILMISTKIACKNGWFHAAEADELVGLANELCNSFCAGVRATTASNALDVISKIIPRFYPRLKIYCLIVSFEAKIGYDILMGGFHIKNNLPPEKRIFLFVVQTDDLETSSCIIRPPQIRFLVNGRDVECVNGSQSHRPQIPTDITKILRCGMNIIQAMGYFTGNYLLAIASVGTITDSDAPILKDYVQPTVSALISDSELIVGPSKISLNCPLSLKRIRCPVKGHLCKHYQCFDYKKFMEMNERIPFWRCICCGQPVSFIDLRVDQNMVKILEEVSEDATAVFIFPDGSWKVNIVHDRSTEQLDKGIQSGRQDADIEGQSIRCPTTLTDAMDLTMGDQSQTRKASVQQVSNVAPPISSNSRPSSSDQGLFAASGVPTQSGLRTHHTISQSTNTPRVPPKQASKKAITSVEKTTPNRLAQITATNLAVARATGLQQHRPSWMASSNPSQRAADGVRLSDSDPWQTMTEVVPGAARVHSFQELPSTQNWRPAGRMRGSLSGAAYSAAINQYLDLSSQSVATRPPASTAARVSLNNDNEGSQHGTLRIKTEGNN